MKIFVNIFAGFILVSIIAFKIFGGVLFPEDFSVNCDAIYNVETNENIVTCTVIDPIDLISDDYPLTMSLINNSSIVVSEHNLIAGENSITLDELLYNTQYTIKISGYELIDDVLSAKVYSNQTFSTIDDDFVLPIISKSNLVVTDTAVSFLLEVTDSQSTITTIDIVISDNGTLIDTITLTDFSNLSISIDSLEELTTYQIEIDVTYQINDFDTLTDILHNFNIETLKTPEMPEASINILSNDNTTLTFNVTKMNMDATVVTYTTVLIDENGTVIYSQALNSNTVSIDISLITLDYRIAILSSYTLNGSSFTDVEIESYNITTNEYSNFFLIPTLNLIDITVPLDDYDDYDDYLYTNFNQGNSEFSIECDPSLDCGTLVDLEPYSSMPFAVVGMVHSFYDTNSISFNYTSQQVNITVQYVYTPIEISAISTEVNNIINTITTTTMTTDQKILAVHDYIVNNAVYDQTCYNTPSTCDNDYDAYGILFDGNGVCEGYADTMDIFLRAMRIPSIRISSDTHQWNGVYVNGSWVHLDATWDDPVSSGGGNTLSHDFYLITSATLSSLDAGESHTYDETYLSFID